MMSASVEDDSRDGSDECCGVLSTGTVAVWRRNIGSVFVVCFDKYCVRPIVQSAAKYLLPSIHTLFATKLRFLRLATCFKHFAVPNHHLCGAPFLTHWALNAS